MVVKRETNLLCLFVIRRAFPYNVLWEVVIQKKSKQLLKLILLVFPTFTISLFPLATISHPKQSEGVNTIQQVKFSILPSDGPGQNRTLFTAKVLAASVGSPGTMFEVGVNTAPGSCFPHVHRQKRSAEGSKRTILEWLININIIGGISTRHIVGLRVCVSF